MSCCKRLLYKYQVNKILLLPIKGLTLVEISLKILVYAGIVLGLACFLKSHQKSYSASSSVVIKLNGNGMTNNERRRIWDSVDSLVPPLEENGLFITTNFIATYNQNQGVCPENLSVKNSICVTDADCQKDRILYLGNGVQTGKCVPAIPNNKTCEIRSWCPLENVDLSTNIIQEIKNYTVLIKNKIVFDHVNVQRSNIHDDVVGRISKDCIHNSSDELLKYCPIFNVSTFIESFKEKNLTKLLIYGGIGRVTINWNCDLDFSLEDCKPEYYFTEIFSDLNDFHDGMNFRYANYYEKDSKEYRDLFTVYGLRILVEVRGYGGKFDPATFFTFLSSQLSYLFIVSVIIGCCLPEEYDKHIYEDVNYPNRNTEHTKEDINEQNRNTEHTKEDINEQNKSEIEMKVINDQSKSECKPLLSINETKT